MIALALDVINALADRVDPAPTDLFVEHNSPSAGACSECSRYGGHWDWCSQAFRAGVR